MIMAPKNDIVPLVSVVMSVFNGARYLGQAVESIIQQQGLDWEFIILNDGSTDDSQKILAGYAARDPRIRVIEQSNQGLTKALIRGCQEARGEFIARQDDDDLSFPGRLAALAALLRNDPRLVFASSWSYVYGPQGELIYDVRRPADPVQATDMLLRQKLGPPGHGSVMFRKAVYERVGGYRPQFYYAQDVDLWLRLGELGLIGYCQQYLYAYSFRESTISAQRWNEQERLGPIVHACRAARLANRDETTYLAQAARIRPPFTSQSSAGKVAGVYFIASCLRHRRDPRARIYYWSVLRQKPYAMKAWFGLLDSLWRGRKEQAQNVTALGLSKVL